MAPSAEQRWPPRRLCAFCGSDAPLTKEDAWPRWLNRALPKLPPGTAIDLSLDGSAVSRASRRTVTGYNTARVPGFCKNCNNGWMSQLEQAACPLLLPMIQGEYTKLTTAEQAVVASWVTKTALVFDQRAKHRRPLVSADILTEFGAHRRPIPGSRVLLAQYGSNDWTLNHFVGGLPAVYADGTEKVVVAIVTLSLGKLVMQLICPTTPDEVRTTKLLERDDSTFAVQLVPAPAKDRTVKWPPPMALTSHNWFEFGLSMRSSVDIADILGRVGPATDRRT